MVAESVSGQTQEKEDSLFDLPEEITVIEDDASVATPDAGNVPAPEGAQGETRAEGQETEGAPTPGTTPPSPGPDFSHLSDDDRRALAEGLLASLPREERERLAPVNELITSARQSESARTRQSLTAEQQEQARVSQAYMAANSLSQRLQEGTVEDYDRELVNFGEQFASVRENAIRRELMTRFSAAATALGVDAASVPPEVRQAAQTAPLLQAVEAVLSHLTQAAMAHGSSQGRTEYEKTDRAAFILDKERHRQEVIAQLQAEGRLRDNVPPVLGGGVTAGSGVVTEEEWAEAMRDQDAYERLRADPEKWAFIQQALATA